MKRNLFILCLCLFAAGLSEAADAVLQKVKGTVMVKTGGADPYQAQAGDPLYFGDEIRTEAGALAHISFTGATLLVKENSTLTLKGNKNDSWVSFDIGEFLIGLKRKLGPKKSFKVRTPAAAAAVRGTLFWGLSDASKDSTYACFAGSIAIQAGGKTVLLEPGQKTKIPFGQAPEATAPAEVPLSYLDTFAVDGSIQGLGDIIKKEAPAPQTPAQEPEPTQETTPETPEEPKQGQ